MNRTIKYIIETSNNQKVFNSPFERPNIIKGKGANTKDSDFFDDNKVYVTNTELKAKLMDRLQDTLAGTFMLIIFIRLITYKDGFDVGYIILCIIASVLFGGIGGILIGSTIGEFYYTDKRLMKKELKGKKDVKRCK